eukprot:10055494-Alexandrium_andersonii.AAC.1
MQSTPSACSSRKLALLAFGPRLSRGSPAKQILVGALPGWCKPASCGSSTRRSRTHRTCTNSRNGDDDSNSN